MGELSNYVGMIILFKLTKKCDKMWGVVKLFQDYFLLALCWNQYVQLKLIILNLFIIFWKSRVE